MHVVSIALLTFEPALKTDVLQLSFKQNKLQISFVEVVPLEGTALQWQGLSCIDNKQVGVREKTSIDFC